MRSEPFTLQDSFASDTDATYLLAYLATATFSFSWAYKQRRTEKEGQSIRRLMSPLQNVWESQFMQVHECMKLAAPTVTCICSAQCESKCDEQTITHIQANIQGENTERFMGFSITAYVHESKEENSFPFSYDSLMDTKVSCNYSKYKPW